MQHITPTKTVWITRRDVENSITTSIASGEVVTLSSNVFTHYNLLAVFISSITSLNNSIAY